MQKTFDITIDDQQPINPNNSFAIYRGDNVAFNFTFQRGGISLDVDGATLRVFAKKIQKNGQVDKLSNPLFAEDFVATNTATFNSSQTCGDAGNYILSVLLVSSDDAVITSQCIYFELKENGYAGEYQPSADFRDEVLNASELAQQSSASAKQSEANAQQSEANAKVSEQIAQQSATSASTSEANANLYSIEALDSSNVALQSKEQTEQFLNETIVAKNEAILAKEQAQEISDPENRIGNLQQTKSNCGELWFNGGFATISNMSMNGSWSLCCRIRMQSAQVKDASIFHLGEFYLSWNTRLGVLCNPAISSVQQILIDDDNRLANGEWHSLVVSYDGTTLKLTDETGVLLSVATSETISILGNLLIGESNYNGQIADVKYFNFDMSSDDALYTIADYIAGKDESPWLQNGDATTYNGEDFAYSPRSTAYACDIEKNGDEVSITSTTEINANYVWLTTPTNSINIKAGSLVECSFDSLYANTKSLSLRFRHTSSESNLYTANIDSNVRYISFTAPTDLNYLHMLVLYNQKPIPLGITLGFKGLKIKVNGTLLSLDDYTFNGKVFDVSGNNNTATITGAVYGTRDNAVEQMYQAFASRIGNLTE